MDSLQIITPGRIRRPRPTPTPEPELTRADSRYCVGCRFPDPLDENGYCSWCHKCGPAEIRERISRLNNGHELVGRRLPVDDGLRYSVGRIVNVR